MNMELYISEFTKMLEEIGRFIRLNEERPDNKELYERNLETLKEVVASEHAIIAEGVSKGITGLEHILSPTEQFLKAADESNYEKMFDNYETLLKYKQDFNDLERNRGNKIIDIFQLDLKEMEIHQAKVKALQELVQIDLKIYGEVNPITLEILSVQHCELIGENVVWEKDVYENMPEREAEHESEHIDTVLKNEPENAQPAVQDTVNENDSEQPYRANVYMKNFGDKKQKAKLVYGSSPENIIDTLQGWNTGRIEEMRFCTCYVSKLNPDTHKYEYQAKYDVTTGADISPIYLELPHMERSEFINTVDQLKKDGARYNPAEKKFFVTKQTDLNKFTKYLPKDSIFTKLNQNKTAVGANKESGQPVKTDRDYSR